MRRKKIRTGNRNQDLGTVLTVMTGSSIWQFVSMCGNWNILGQYTIYGGKALQKVKKCLDRSEDPNIWTILDA